MSRALRGGGRKRRKKPIWGKVLFAFLTFLNILLAVVLKVTDRQQVLKAVKDEEEVRLLLCTEKQTKTCSSGYGKEAEK